MRGDIYSTGNAIVDENAKLNITGNIIPQMWYRTIVRDNGKPNLTAIVVLADIVYWYKPTEQRDENTGQIIAVKKKFKADLLQRSYQQISEQFGISKKEATNAVIFLEKLGVIKRVFRTVTINGLVINNVLYLELVVERLKEKTYPEECAKQPSSFKEERVQQDTGHIGSESQEGRELAISKETAPSFQRERVPPLKEGPVTIKEGEDTLVKEKRPSSKSQTNTEITTEIINRDYTNPILSYQAVESMFKQQIDYDAIRIDRPYDSGILDEIVAIAVDVFTSSAKTIRINREDRSVEIVKQVYQKLCKGTIELVMDSIRNCSSKAINIRAVIMTALYNATMTVNSYFDNLFAYHEGLPQT
ncbi:MAG: DUF6017 domain-containing protein [Lachnospiraceae bacterium]